MNSKAGKRPGICTSVSGKSFDEVRARIGEAFSQGSDIVEVRTDHLEEFNPASLAASLGERTKNCILTCRRRSDGGAFQKDENDRLAWILKLSRLGPKYLDVEVDLASKILSRVSPQLQLLVSWHDSEKTPSIEELEEVHSEATKYSNVCKIVTQANGFKDNLTILSLYKKVKKGSLVAFCMGERGILSRVLCPYFGSPFTYASLKGLPVAPGQVPVDQLRSFYDAFSAGD